jgi:hypothetical protein
VRNAHIILVGEPSRKRQLGRPRRRWKIILECILGKYGWKVRTGCIWFRIGTSEGVGPYENGNEYSDPI